MRTQRITEKYICDRLIEMMEQVPFHKIKLVDFQKYCGISKSTFYIYFDSIYSVIQRVEDDVFNDLATLNEETPESTKASPLARGRKMKSYLRVFRILCDTDGDPAFQARLINHFKKQINLMLGVLPLNISEAENALIVEHIANGQVCMLKWWAFHEDEISLNNFISVYQDMIRGSIATVLNKFGIAPNNESTISR